MRYLKFTAILPLIALSLPSCSGKGDMHTDGSAKADTIQTEMTTPPHLNVAPEAAKALASKVAGNEALTSDDYDAMLDYILVMGAKMGEAMNKADIDSLMKIPGEYPESDIFIKALGDAAASNKLDKEQLAKARKFKELIGEDEI